MKKLIEMKMDNLIECDNPKCDFTIPNPTGDPNAYTDMYINMPCPQCGQNLLTEEDDRQFKAIMRTVNRINRWFGWIAYLIPRKKEKKGGFIKVHDGIKITDK